jgi:hypothetical protein
MGGPVHPGEVPIRHSALGPPRLRGLGPAPRSGVVCTGCGIRHQRTWLGGCWRVGCAGVRIDAVSWWALLAMARARPRASVSHPSSTCPWSASVIVKGQQLASPQAVVAHTAQRTGLVVAWYGGSTKDIEVVTGTGPWSRMGEALVEVRWLYVHDGPGTHRDESCLTTDSTMKPPPLVECYTPRWSIETTFQEGREYLKLASTKSDRKQTVRRFTPCVFGLDTVVVLFSRQLPRSSSIGSAVFWSSTATVTFSAMMTCVRRVCWAPWCFHTQAAPQEFSKLSQPLQEIILHALAPAA